jgi:hypothetical protein
MVANQIKAWEIFRRELPWLQESDRALVEAVSVIRGRLIAGEDVSVGALNCLRVCCGMMDPGKGDGYWGSGRRPNGRLYQLTRSPLTPPPGPRPPLAEPAGTLTHC